MAVYDAGESGRSKWVSHPSANNKDTHSDVLRVRNPHVDHAQSIAPQNMHVYPTDTAENPGVVVAYSCIYMHFSLQDIILFPLPSIPLSVLTPSFPPPFIPTSLKALNFQHLTPSIIVDTNPTTATADAQPTFGKYIQFDLNTGAIIDKATEYLKPEKLTALLEEHKSPSPPTHLTLSHRTNNI